MTQLALPGPENGEASRTGQLKIRGCTVHVQQRGGQGEGTGWAIWDGAVVMAKYIEAASQIGFRGCPDWLLWTMHCVELGSGTGLAGIAASRCLDVASNTIILTDLPDVLPSLSMNAAQNVQMTYDGESAVDMIAAPLDWRQASTQVPALITQHMPKWCDVPSRDTIAKAATRKGWRGAAKHLVLAADCVWVPELVQPFLDTLRELHARVPFTRQFCVVLAYKSRSSQVDEMLFSGLRKTFEVSELPQLQGEARGSVQLWLATAPGGATLQALTAMKAKLPTTF